MITRENAAALARLKWSRWTQEARTAEMRRIARLPRRRRLRGEVTKEDSAYWKRAALRSEKRRAKQAQRIATLSFLEKELQKIHKGAE